MVCILGFEPRIDGAFEAPAYASSARRTFWSEAPVLPWSDRVCNPERNFSASPAYLVVSPGNAPGTHCSSGSCSTSELEDRAQVFSELTLEAHMISWSG